MTVFVFDETKALAACQRYAADADPQNFGAIVQRKRDVAGFWRVLRSLPGQEKLAVQPSKQAGGLSPEGAYQTERASG